MGPVRFQRVSEWDAQDIIELYRSAGWWEDYYDPSGILPLIQGSDIFAVGICEKTGRAVAMGRIISDRVKTGYIHDLCVLNEYRGKQIGTRLLTFLVETGQASGLESLLLVAEPDTSRFYMKSGFVCKNGLFFLLMNTDGTNEN